MPKLKVGDQFVFTQEMYNADGCSSIKAQGLIGKKITVDFVSSTNYQGKEIDFWWFPIRTTDPYLPNNPNIMSNLTEKFALAFKKEPQKSFRKAGITDGDDLLTAEGQSIFLSWLLNSKYADDFKKEVADEILKLKKEEKD